VNIYCVVDVVVVVVAVVQVLIMQIYGPY